VVFFCFFSFDTKEKKGIGWKETHSIACGSLCFWGMRCGAGSGAARP